jgi:glucose/mannose-6-phosphate isomerase
MPRPWLVVRDYHWPACVGPRSLAVLSSNSGNTEETLALEREAAERAVPRVGLSSGGQLADRLHAAGAHCQAVPSGMPPRAALFHAWVPMTRLVSALGWVPDPGAAWREAAVQTRARLAELGAGVPESANPAKQMARACHGRLIMVYAASGPMAAVALRMRQQLHENAKLLGHSAAVPELNHNEIVGWQAPGALHRSISVLVLRDREDSAEATTRLDLTAEYAVRQGAAVHEIRTAGESRIARLASVVQFGDHLSFHLALLGGVDPTDITSIDEFKRRLSEHTPPRTR